MTDKDRLEALRHYASSGLLEEIEYCLKHPGYVNKKVFDDCRNGVAAYRSFFGHSAFMSTKWAELEEAYLKQQSQG